MTLKFPVLKHTDRAFYPAKGGSCPICGKDFKGLDGIAYLCAGAVVDEEETGLDSNQMEAFLCMHYHTNASDCSGNAEVNLVDHLRGGQFDLMFCSTACLRRFLNYAVDELESRMKSTVPLTD